MKTSALGVPSRLLVATVVATSLAACSGSSVSVPRIVAPNSNPGSEAFGEISAGEHVSVGEMVLCLNGRGRAVIQSVRPVGTTGFRVVAFAVRPNPILHGHSLLGAAYATLRSQGFDPKAHTITGPCKKDGSTGVELGVELVATSSTPTSSTGWQLQYRSRGTSQTTDIPTAIELCPDKLNDDGKCGQQK